MSSEQTSPLSILPSEVNNVKNLVETGKLFIIYIFSRCKYFVFYLSFLGLADNTSEMRYRITINTLLQETISIHLPFLKCFVVKMFSFV